MDSTAIIGVLSRAVPAAGLEPIQSADGMPTIAVAREQLVETCRALRDTPELGFAFLADLLPIDYLPRVPRFEITYLLASLGIPGYGDTAKRLRLKVRVPGGEDTLGPLGDVGVAGRRLVRARGRTICSGFTSAITPICGAS